jgi:hypothetical protein
MKPLPFVWPYALVFWGVFVWGFMREFGIVRRATRDRTAADAKSLQVIMFGMNIAFLGAFFSCLGSRSALQRGLRCTRVLARHGDDSRWRPAETPLLSNAWRVIYG